MGKLRTLRPSVAPIDVRTAAMLPTSAAFNDPRRGSSSSRGYGWEWQKLRAQILKRDGYQCQCSDCKARRIPLPANDVDHIVPRGDGGTDDPSNLQAMASDCHKLKTARENAARRGSTA